MMIALSVFTGEAYVDIPGTASRFTPELQASTR
jgi:hypothetical protein